MENQNVNPKPLITFQDPNDPEQRDFLILIVGTDSEGREFKDFDTVTGRTASYWYLKDRIEWIDVLESKIIAYTDLVVNGKSVAKFMKYCVESELVEDPGFDITDYMGGSDDGTEQQSEE